MRQKVEVRACGRQTGGAAGTEGLPLAGARRQCSSSCVRCQLQQESLQVGSRAACRLARDEPERCPVPLCLVSPLVRPRPACAQHLSPQVLQSLRGHRVWHRRLGALEPEEEEVRAAQSWCAPRSSPRRRLAAASSTPLCFSSLLLSRVSIYAPPFSHMLFVTRLDISLHAERCGCYA